MVKLVPVESRRTLVGHFAWWVSWVAVTGFAAFLRPSSQGHGTHTELGLPPCPCVLFFGRPCPGCGLTTSFTNLVHGNVLAAFRAHPFGPILYLIFTVTAWVCFYGWLKRKHFDTGSKQFSRAVGAFIIVFLIFGVARFILSPHYADHDPFHQAFVAKLK